LKADEALLKAQQGEWPVEFYKQDEGQADYSGFTLVQSLRQALENDEFKLVYQPVMDLETHQTSYFEALLRWKKPNQHPYPIEKTIEMAEKNQLIKPLTNWIIETACLQLQMLSHPRARIAINLSMIELHDRELPERIEQAMQRCGISPQQLLIEITEGQIMQDPERVIEILSRLSQMGISLLIDDFGTGQASLTYLKKLPVEKLKIDQSFVKDMVFNDEDRTIVEATIKLAHTLAIKVVAEGVETAETLDLLSEMGCDYVQGYYISRPIEQDQVVSWCHQQDEQVLSL
jgi:EAL domain-containing protein (putative c-di-GMP-specific phosphodiesterase class I)